MERKAGKPSPFTDQETEAYCHFGWLAGFDSGFLGRHRGTD